MSKKLKTLISMVVILLIWQIVAMSGIYSQYLLPSPKSVFDRCILMLTDGILATHVYFSIKRVFIGYLIALVSAFLVALFSYKLPKVMEFFDWIIQFFRNVPPLGLIPLLILWFGIGEDSKIIIIILASFFPMYLMFEKGFKSTDPKIIEVGKAFGLSSFGIFKKIVMPSAVADILVGMRTGLGYSYRAIIGAEMIAASSGLGYMVNFARSMSQTDVVIVGIIAIGLLGYLSDYIFKIAIAKFLKDTRGYGWN